MQRVGFSSSLPFVLIALLFFLHNTNGQANGGICGGMVGSFNYSLDGLSEATGGGDVTCQDSNGNTYYYRPCQVLQNELCQMLGDTAPAVCLKDTRKIPQYHDAGSTTQVSWSPRVEGFNTGFFMSFRGGEEDRQSTIEFICDPSAGTGTFVAAQPTENPTHFYHLKWRTQYACPQNNNTNNSSVQCCHYVIGRAGAKRTTCGLQSELCPLTLGPYRFAGNSTATSCSDCGTPTWSCCVYANSQDSTNLASQCVNTKQCPKLVVDNDIVYKVAGNFTVNDCSNCFVV